MWRMFLTYQHYSFHVAGNEGGQMQVRVDSRRGGGEESTGNREVQVAGGQRRQ